MQCLLNINLKKIEKKRIYYKKKIQNLKIATILPYKENYTFEKLQQHHYGSVDFLKIQNIKKIILFLDIQKIKII